MKLCVRVGGKCLYLLSHFIGPKLADFIYISYQDVPDHNYSQEGDLVLFY